MKIKTERKFFLRNAEWIYGENQDISLQWASGEATRLVNQLTGSSIIGAAAKGKEGRIIVGSPLHNALIKAENLPELKDPSALGPDDYIIRSDIMGGLPVLYIAGLNDRAAMYGLFAFFEALGCRFLLSQDTLPDVNPALVIPRLDITGHTHSSWRAIWLQFCLVSNSIMSLQDYERLFAQMAKMRMNRVIYYHFENEPFMDYSYSGERRLLGDATHPDSACMSLGRQDAGTFRVADLIVGREHFDREFVSPLEFQRARTSAEMLDTGRAFMQELIRLALRRGIGTWISFDSTFVSLNLAKYTRRMARPSEFYCALTSCTDPVVSEINHNRIESIVKAYPDIEGIFFQITEGAYEDLYPDSQNIIDREWPKYREAYELLKKHWGKHWQGEATQRTYMRGDIGFVERMKQSLAAAREIKPDLRLGILTVCKAYLLTYLDKILPKDMPFVDIESQSLWTVDGAPLHLFQRMKGRECVLVPRAYDDGSVAGLQFNLNLYQRDGFLASRKKNGTSGLCIQTSHISGNDHNVRFLAEGMWNEDFTPEAFYRDYTEAIFGSKAVEPTIKAFQVLETNEAALGGRGLHNMGYSLNPPEIKMIRAAKNYSTPFFSAPWDDGAVQALTDRTERFTQAIGRLDEALGWFEAARESCRTSGLKELEYLISKTRAYRCHLRTLCILRDAYAQYVEAFAQLETKGVAVCREGLQKALRETIRAEGNAIEAASNFTQCIAHPTDLAVVWMMNHTIIACRVFRQFTDNVLAYYEGREYWNKVDWELLYDTSPFPTYQIEGRNQLVLG